MPEEYKLVKNSETGKISEVIPGEFRTEDVIVGKHFAPAHSSIPGFMDRFKEFYNPAKYDSTDKIIAAAASHHRFSWIHPFLDGNGRVNRLYTGAWFLFSGINEKRLWSLSRGLSRNRDEYNNRLANADTERKNDYDGRGNLSDEELYLFCTFIILTSIDQIDFMSSLLVLNKIEERIINP